MKKQLLVALFLCPFLIKAQSAADTDLLSEFVGSEDFRWFVNESKSGNGVSADLSQSEVFYEEYQGRKVPFLKVALVKDLRDGTMKKVGEIEAVKVREDYRRLPRGAKYLQIYKDLEEYDFSDGTGRIRVYDLNYEEYLVADALVVQEQIVEIRTFQMPQDIALQYGFAGARGEDTLGRPHPCDGNQNGNVSFGECISCMLNACLGDAECRKLCRLTGVVRCGTAFTLACTWIAIWY